MRRVLGTVGIGVALVLVAGLFAVDALYVPGVAFVLLGVFAFAWVRVAARRVTVTRRIDVRSAVEDEPVPARIEVRSGSMPLASARVEDPLLPGPLSVPSGRGGVGVGAVLDVELRFARRGRRALPPPRLVLHDPLGLARAVVRGGGTDELLVLPRVSRIASAGSRGSDAGRPSGIAALLNAAASEVDGLRPYREGTPAARIHWQALARGAGLMERRLRNDGDARPLVVLDPRGAVGVEDLDAAVRAAASLCVALARAGGCALLLPGDRRATAIAEDLSGWPAAHVRLALVEGDAGTPAPALGTVGVRRGPLLYVAARHLDRLPAGAATIAQGGTTLVVPGRLPGNRAPAFSVAGCHGYLVARRTVEVDAA